MSRFSRAFRGRGPVPVGTWIKLPAAESVEAAATAGFDFVVVDLEHTLLSYETAAAHIRLASALGLLPFVRVPDHGPSLVQRLLDGGAAGILFPHVDDADTAARTASATRFPPYGTRGSGGTSRAGAYGALPRAEYLRRGNEDVLCLPQLESRRAMAAATDILAVDGVDGVFLGAADLALDLGLPGTDPHVTELVAGAAEAARAAGKPSGVAYGAAPSRLADAAADGHGFVVLGNDTSLLADAARKLCQDARRALAERAGPSAPDPHHDKATP
ncbi:HpcH/HpaI aldolase/citrate lyase family protein [Streptomyces sp. NBUA17]|uniref:HpcH/HpaI aldolase family protein n=1 Tax=Streptomyces sp. NBUA17 TaxID=3062275 RepID=UPI0037D996AB